MKRILLVVLVVCLLAGQASAAMYVMDAATAINLRDVFYTEATGSLDWVGYNDGTAFPTSQAGNRQYGSGDYDEGMYYSVGFRGDLEYEDWDGGDPHHPSVDIGAGYLSSTVLSLQGLGSFDSYGLHIANDNTNTWEYKLYATFDALPWGNALVPLRSETWTPLGADTQTFLTLSLLNPNPFGPVLDFVYLTDIGFEMRATQATDTFHTSVVPVPTAVLLGILGLSVAGWKLRRFA